jgi:hypothetical protein
MNSNNELNDTWLQSVSINLKFDTKLKLSNDNISSELTKNTELQQSNIEKLNSVAEYPTPHIFAIFASKAYDDVENKNDNPSGWKLLTTASNDSNSYFGTAYLNVEKHQIIIAHRGTDPNHWQDILTDIRGIILNKYVTQMNSAITFAHKIISTVKELKLDHFQLFFTGHSLGGWLAQITTLTTKYPIIFNKIAEGLHAHTVVFESPGCEQMLVKIAAILLNIQDKLSPRYSKKTSIDIYSLDITIYLSAPNRINTFNKHVGKIYRIIIDLSDESNTNSNFEYLKKLFRIDDLNDWLQYNFKTHSILNILKAFDLSTGHVLKNQIYEVLDWPYCTLSNRQEYKNFFKSIYVDEKDENICTPNRYKTKNYEENKCSISVFTETEQFFLKMYQILRSKLKVFQFVSFFNLISDNDDVKRSVQKMLNNFEIKNNEIVCLSKSPNKFIPYIKMLLQLFPNVKAETVKQSLEYDIYIKFYQLVSNQYFSSFDFQNNNNFAVTLKEILNDQNTKIFQMFVEEDTYTSLAIIYKVLEKINSKYKIVAISLERFLNTNQELPLINLFKFKDESIHLFLLIECKPNNNIDFNKVEVLLKKLISLNNESKSIKIVLVTHEDYYSTELFSSHFCEKIKPEGVKWNDFTYETKDKILNKKVLFQGNQISLNELIQASEDKEEELNNLFDTKTLIKLLNNNSIKIGKPLFDDKYYIPRSLNYHIRIKKDAFTNKNNEFLISCDDAKELSNNTNCIFVSNDEEALNKFKGSKTLIHWLKYEPHTQSYIWQKSKENIFVLRMGPDKKKFKTTCHLTFLEKKIVRPTTHKS